MTRAWQVLIAGPSYLNAHLDHGFSILLRKDLRIQLEGYEAFLSSGRSRYTSRSVEETFPLTGRRRPSFAYLVLILYC